MLSRLDLKNFKSFSNLDNFELKPITILCGSNSCGKSSILHSLLLQKQTKESKNPNQLLLLNGKYIHLGDFENIIHGTDKTKEITIKYEYLASRKSIYGNSQRGDKKSILVGELRRFINRKIRSSNRDLQNYKISAEYTLKSTEKRKGYIKSAEIINLKIKLTLPTSTNEDIEGPIVEIEKCGQTYTITWENIEPLNYPSPFFKEDGKKILNCGRIESTNITFEGLNPIIQFDYANVVLSSNKQDEMIEPFSVSRFIHTVNNYINLENNELSYIGPLREEPSRRYIYENEVLDIGVKGENAAYIYQTEQDTAITEHYIYDLESETYKIIESETLQSSLARWLHLMGINNFIHNHEGEIIRLKMAANSCEETMVNIADVGFGVSQIFPILLEGLRMKKNASLILEQPEIHLHPALQMKMADYLITLALSNKNIIVETHSDHIINRIVRRIVEDSELSINDLVAIYFVKNNHNGATVEPIKINPSRGIVNWPKGFFDQTASEQELIIKAGIKKRMNKKEI